MTEQERKRDMDGLRDFLTVIFKHKVKIIAVFLAIVITAGAAVFLLPPTYQAESTLLVKFGREYIYHPVVGNEQEEKDPPAISQEENVNSEINILTSQDLIEKVISAIGVDNIYPGLARSSSWLADAGIGTSMTPLQAAELRFSKNLHAEAVRRSSVISVSFRHRDPQIAARALNLLVNFYKVKHLQVYSGLQSPFLEKQLDFYDRKLTDSENRLESFKQKNQVYSLDEQRSLLLGQRMSLDTGLKNTKSQIDGLQNKLLSLKAQMKKIAASKNWYTPTERDKIIVDVRVKLFDLRLKEQHLLQQYKPDNLMVVNVRQQIAIAEDFLKKQDADITKKVKTGNAVYQQAETDAIQTEAALDSDLAKRGILSSQLGQVNASLRALDSDEEELENLNRETQIDDQNYRTYAAKVEEARISDDMNRRKMAYVSVIQEAQAPFKPVAPRRMLDLLGAVILGLVSGIGYAFLSEYYSQGISTTANVEKRLDLPVLATVPYRK